MNAENQIKQVEISIEKAREQIDRSKMLHRLEKNKDFKALFLDGLLREGAVEQVHLLGSPQLFAPGDGATAARNSIMARMGMIAEFANYCRYIHLQGESSAEALHEHENAHEELLAEQLED